MQTSQRFTAVSDHYLSQQVTRRRIARSGVISPSHCIRRSSHRRSNCTPSCAAFQGAATARCRLLARTRASDRMLRRTDYGRPWHASVAAPLHLHTHTVRYVLREWRSVHAMLIVLHVSPDLLRIHPVRRAPPTSPQVTYGRVQVRDSETSSSSNSSSSDTVDIELTKAHILIAAVRLSAPVI